MRILLKRHYCRNNSANKQDNETGGFIVILKINQNINKLLVKLV